MAATGSHIALAITLDVLVLLVCVFVAAFAGGIGWAVVAVVGFLAASGWVLLSRGRTLGLRLAGGRVVIGSTASAPGTRLDGWRIADTRRGADPLLPRYHPPALFASNPAPVPAQPERTAATAEPQTRRRRVAVPATRAGASGTGSGTVSGGIAPAPGVRAPAFVLVIDDGARVSVSPVMVVGRDPAASEGAAAVAVPDLARELSKAHFRIDRDSAGLFSVTDLSSTNGTMLNGADVTPHQPFRFGANDTIEAGGHRFRVEPRVRIETGEAV